MQEDAERPPALTVEVEKSAWQRTPFAGTPSDMGDEPLPLVLKSALVGLAVMKRM